MSIHPASRRKRRAWDVESTKSSWVVSGNAQSWLSRGSTQSLTYRGRWLLSGIHTLPLANSEDMTFRRCILSARPGLYALTGKCALCKSWIRLIPADLSSIKIKSTRFFSRPSPYTTSYSSKTFGRRSGYCSLSCQQSINKTLIGPSRGLNTPHVDAAVGSFTVFSLVATS